MFGKKGNISDIFKNENLSSALNYKGIWDADANSPTLGDSGLNGVLNDFYVIGTAGTTSIDGVASWAVGDWIIHNGSIWQKIPNANTVTSVASKVGAVTLVKDDISNFVEADYLHTTGNETFAGEKTFETAKIGDVSGGNYSEFESDGTLKFNGGAVVYNDLPPIPIVNTRVGPTAPTFTTFIDGIYQYTFGINDECFGSYELMHEYKEGSDLSVHLHWATNGTNVNDRNVNWEFTYTISDPKVSAPFNTSFPAQTIISNEFTIPANSNSLCHIITTLGTISGAGLKIGAYICWRLRRIASSGTAPSNNPYALSLGIHIESDTTGSRQTYIK